MGGETTTEEGVIGNLNNWSTGSKWTTVGGVVAEASEMKVFNCYLFKGKLGIIPEMESEKITILLLL